jgi:hypothetical protein
MRHDDTRVLAQRVAWGLNYYDDSFIYIFYGGIRKAGRRSLY